MLTWGLRGIQDSQISSPCSVLPQNQKGEQAAAAFASRDGRRRSERRDEITEPS